MSDEKDEFDEVSESDNDVPQVTYEYLIFDFEWKSADRPKDGVIVRMNGNVIVDDMCTADGKERKKPGDGWKKWTLFELLKRSGRGGWEVFELAPWRYDDYWNDNSRKNSTVPYAIFRRSKINFSAVPSDSSFVATFIQDQNDSSGLVGSTGEEKDSDDSKSTTTCRGVDGVFRRTSCTNPATEKCSCGKALCKRHLEADGYCASCSAGFHGGA